MTDLIFNGREVSWNSNHPCVWSTWIIWNGECRLWFPLMPGLLWRDLTTMLREVKTPCLSTVSSWLSEDGDDAITPSHRSKKISWDIASSLYALWWHKSIIFLHNTSGRYNFHGKGSTQLEICQFRLQFFVYIFTSVWCLYLYSYKHVVYVCASVNVLHEWFVFLNSYTVEHVWFILL